MTYLSQWLDANEFFINLKKGKTECMLFGTAKRLSTLKDQQLSVNFKDSAINVTSSYKYFFSLSDRPFTYLLIYLFTYLFVCLFFGLLVRWLVCYLYLFIYLFIYLSIYLFTGK